METQETAALPTEDSSGTPPADSIFYKPHLFIVCMRNQNGDTFNDITIDLRGGGGGARTNNYHGNGYDVESTSAGSVPSRQSRYSAYPQVRPTNPLYASQSTLKTQGSNGRGSSKSSATLVTRRQKFDPQAPRRPSDWRWLAILCVILFFPTGLFAFAFARKAQNKFHDGFVPESHKLNKRALILCIVSILCGVALIIGLLFAFDAWPRTNG
ncbi:unnamed protein product [Didymodactylos carnosus]|uniref:Uncharacterized protein n=1 Tax=Didymodactylos carnosus TaxID=1234261 RepID=A0A814CPK9_9BILA|nr:unnamed protein product [Didymodactylos carnosus]CAF0946225.1 unnamed protein product [Didymodactylos carnosus]CAF3508307.1 unnamed protein product [Didymodactylos carnosus]CAF3722364.1 unnamed protein product [Didymodactylos carnosus]